jgi:phosphoenolpyruvate-protein phosphotransferase (PTS system enzyme I)
MRLLTGLPASAGAGAGPAWVLDRPALHLPRGPAADPEADAAALEAALAGVAELLEARAAAVAGEPADILRAQAAMALDPELAGRSARLVREARVPAARAVVEVGERYARALAESGSEYLAARAADVAEVCRLAAGALLDVPEAVAPPPGTGPHVVVAEDLSPAAVAELDPERVVAVATAAGSPVSHAAIVARALGIPAAVGVPGLLAAVAPGTTVLVDGDEGTVLVDPDAAALERAARRDAPARPAEVVTGAVTADGHRVGLAVNVAGPAELRAAVALGAAAVGLFRTELAYLRAAAPPPEDELAAALAEMTGLLAGGRLVVRTFDFGADKLPRFLADARGAEANPALGVRGLRLARRHPDLLRTQLRAVARAAAGGARLAVMAPMVATVDDADWFLAACEEAGCRAAGVEVGVMVEVPAAVLCAAELAARVDFLSIGTNDLGQYLLAADRQEAALADLQDPFQPALLRAVRMVCAAAAGRAHVGVCGEAGGDPLWAALAAGAGVDELSMAAGRLDGVRAALSRQTLARCRDAMAAACEAPTAAEARRVAAAALEGTHPTKSAPHHRDSVGTPGTAP